MSSDHPRAVLAIYGHRIYPEHCKVPDVRVQVKVLRVAPIDHALPEPGSNFGLLRVVTQSDASLFEHPLAQGIDVRNHNFWVNAFVFCRRATPQAFPGSEEAGEISASM